MKLTLTLIAALFTASAWASVPAYCEKADLYNTENVLIYNFRYTDECESALQESRRNKGRFCDRGTLVREDGVETVSFTYSSGCSDALKSLTFGWTGLFCGDYSKIYQINPFVEIADMGFDLECKTAMHDAMLWNGLFCNKGQMYTRLGKKLRDYHFESACRQALPQVSRGPF